MTCIAGKLATQIAEKGTVTMPRHLPGIKNKIADGLSRDYFTTEDLKNLETPRICKSWKKTICKKLGVDWSHTDVWEAGIFHQLICEGGENIFESKVLVDCNRTLLIIPPQEFAKPILELLKESAKLGITKRKPLIVICTKPELWSSLVFQNRGVKARRWRDAKNIFECLGPDGSRRLRSVSITIYHNLLSSFQFPPLTLKTCTLTFGYKHDEKRNKVLKTRNK